MAEKRNIVGFKKFSDIKSKSKVEEIDPSFGLSPDKDSDRPMNPNLPTDSKRFEKPFKGDVTPEIEDSELEGEDSDDDSVSESNVKTFGKVAKFPKNVKASKAYNFLENVKISKKSIWYIMVERQENELQMVKYNYKEGVDLSKFVNELKTYYLSKYSSDKKTCKMIEGIKVDGNDKYSMIQNIPLVELEGRKMISVITEDLIKLLSK
jgi:hypothetical protein